MASYQRIGNIKGAKGDSPTSSEIQTAIKTVMKTLTWGSLA